MAEVIKFYRISEPYGCFSNFSNHPIFIRTTWLTVEHYFQAQKFTDGTLQMKIQAAKSPMIAARMGRNRAWPLRPDWDEVKDGIMRKAVKAKVIQHADVRETLLSTGTAEIVEHTGKDRYWGDGGDGSGRNMLGRILMDVRAELTKDGPFDELADALPPPWIKHPEIERYAIGWRMGYGEGYLCEWGPWYRGLSEAGKRKYQRMYPEPEGWRGYWSDARRAG